MWIEACINEALPSTTTLEEGLRNGVYLGKLGHFMVPDQVPLKKIYDKDLSRYNARGLHFRHTDNINHFLRAMDSVGFPSIFYPETTDIYDGKNIPRVIYCIHALSLYLFKLGKAPQIQDLYGKIKFTDDEINAMRLALEKYGIQMPAFSKIGGILATEMPVDEAALHAAVIAINDALDKQVVDETIKSLENPAAHLVNIRPHFAGTYQQVMYSAKFSKAEIARNKSLDPDSSYIPDVYDELLTQAEIQGNINKINTDCGLDELSDAVITGDANAFEKALQNPDLGLRNLKTDCSNNYMDRLGIVIHNKQNNNNDGSPLTKDEVQLTVNAANTKADEDFQKQRAVELLNQALDKNDTAATMSALSHPALAMPGLCGFAAALYHVELGNMKQEKQTDLSLVEISGGCYVLSAVGLINQAVSAGDPRTTFATLTCEESCLVQLDEGCKEKYQQALEQAKSIKDSSCPFLTHYEIQQVVNDINCQVLSENDRIVAVEKINEAIDQGQAIQTFNALSAPATKLQDVDKNQTSLYQMMLAASKTAKKKEHNDPDVVLWYQEIQVRIL